MEYVPIRARLVMAAVINEYVREDNYCIERTHVRHGIERVTINRNRVCKLGSIVCFHDCSHIFLQKGRVNHHLYEWNCGCTVGLPYSCAVKHAGSKWLQGNMTHKN